MHNTLVHAQLSCACTGGAKDQGQDEAGANSAGGEAMVGGVVPKLNLGLLKKS